MQSDGKNLFICAGLNGDIVDAVTGLYQKWKDQPKDLVVNLEEDSISGCGEESKCEAVFAYMVEHVSFLLDPAGTQMIKSPARLLADGNGDCKSLTMFVSCCLHCLGISHIIRFVSFDGDNQFTHVYPVALLQDGREVIMDMCETDADGVVLFDYARPYTKKKDFVYYE